LGEIIPDQFILDIANRGLKLDENVYHNKKLEKTIRTDSLKAKNEK